MFRSIATSATLTLILGCATVAYAQPARVAGDAPRALVSYADLNLGSASGRAQLAYRVSAAATALCGPAPSIRDLGAAQAHRACLRETIASSTPTLDQAAALQTRSQDRLAAAGDR